MRKYILTLVLFLFICPNIANACSNSDEVKYQELAKNISYSYDYIEENGNISFNVTFSNINENLYLYDYTNDVVHDRIGDEMTLTGFSQGNSYKFGVYTSDIASGCVGNTMYIMYVNIPYYNPYYQDELCKGIEDYKFCNKWLNMNITYDTFKNNVLKYKESLTEEKKQNENQKVEGFFDKLVSFYVDYYYIILPLLIIISVVYIRIYNKKHDLF